MTFPGQQKTTCLITHVVLQDEILPSQQFYFIKTIDVWC